MMYVFEYLVYHLKPYGHNTIVKIDCNTTSAKKNTRNLPENLDQSEAKGSNLKAILQTYSGSGLGENEVTLDRARQEENDNSDTVKGVTNTLDKEDLLKDDNSNQNLGNFKKLITSKRKIEPSS